MKQLRVTVVLLLMIPARASAQNASHPYRAEGYAFAAYEATVGPSGGGGGDVFLYKGLGVGGEIVEAESPFRNSPYVHSSTFRESIISINICYGAPNTSKRKLEPFATGGNSMFYAPGSSLAQPGGFNVGVGANIWLAKHAALRLEFRGTHGGRTDRIDVNSDAPPRAVSQNIFSFRVGVTFR